MPDGSPVFPAIEPFAVHHFAVDEPHVLYVEEVGRPDGLPVLFLHGGPGSGCNADQRRYFDPGRFRVVLFDQRGAGRSTPRRCLVRNTTADLVADIERIRGRLGVPRWMVVGGSWGGTLALAYAQAHPERVLGLVLRSVFLGGRSDFEWAFRDAARTFWPELWRGFVGALPESERADPLAAYGARLMSPDPAVHVPAARAWSDYERALSVLRPVLPDFHALGSGPSAGGEVPNSPFLEWHYLSHGCFLAEGQLERDAGRLAAIPGIIVQGRYDLLCPPGPAAALAAAWPGCELRIVAGAGHAVSEPAILDALLAAIAEMGARLG